MKEHLKKFHLAAAEHHTRMAKAHAAAAGAHDRLLDGHEEVAAAHRQMGAAHVAHAEEHVAFCKALESAPDTLPAVGRITDRGEGGDLDGARKAAMGNPWGDRGHRIMPTAVQGVLPDAPGAGLRLIPRVGGAEVPTKQVDPALRDLVE